MRAEWGSQWDTRKGDPRSGTSMSCQWADHSQAALASPEFRRASQCPWASKSLVLPRGEKGINTVILESCTGSDWDGGDILHSSPTQYGVVLWVCG